MFLKTIVDEILKKKNRSLSWLSVEMKKTFDGLKLSLVKGSIKYNDILLMAKVLNVPPAIFFEESNPLRLTDKDALKPVDGEHQSELVATLKDQLKDKEKIILLLSK